MLAETDERLESPEEKLRAELAAAERAAQACHTPHRLLSGACHLTWMCLAPSYLRQLRQPFPPPPRRPATSATSAHAAPAPP